MRIVTPKDKERINEVAHGLKNSLSFSWNTIAHKTGWSATTVRNHYDENWYPGKYYKKAMPSVTYKNELDCAGIYLLAERIIKDDKIINLIKIGQATNLKNRLNSYKGSNPFAECIDTMKCDKKDLNDIEHLGHEVLGTKNHRYGKTEWFICSDEEYQWWTTHKLTAFRRHYELFK